MTDTNNDAAVRAHDQLMDSSTEAFKAVISAAIAALRMMSVVNAGGALALLGFFGALAGKEKTVLTSSAVFIFPMTLFATGLIVAVFATGIMYLAQLSFHNAVATMRLDYMHPYTHDTPSSIRWQRCGVAFQFVSILCAVTSFAAFVWALWACRALILSIRL